jgi:hypothetical protein
VPGDASRWNLSSGRQFPVYRRNDMDKSVTVLTLSQQEKMRLDMIVIDQDKDEALSFLTELHRKIEKNAIRRMKSHLDA